MRSSSSVATTSSSLVAPLLGLGLESAGIGDLVPVLAHVLVSSQTSAFIVDEVDRRRV